MLGHLQAADSISAYTLFIPHLKMRRCNVPPNYRIEKYHQLLDYFFGNGGFA